MSTITRDTDLRAVYDDPDSPTATIRNELWVLDYRACHPHVDARLRFGTTPLTTFDEMMDLMCHRIMQLEDKVRELEEPTKLDHARAANEQA